MPKKHLSMLQWVSLLAIGALIFLVGLGQIGLLDPDEPRYAQAAREMIQRHDYLTPYFNGEVRLQKPILTYWLIILAYRLFGVHEWSARVWPALSAIAGVLMVAWCAARHGGAFIGWAAGLILSTSAEYVILGRLATTDMLLAWWMTLALIAWFEQRYLLWWIASALAMLTKGPVGVVVPCLIIVGYVAWSRDWVRLKLMRWRIGLVLFVAIALPWYLAVARANGWDYLYEFFIRQNLTRYIADPYERAQPFWYFLPAILVGAFPWSCFWPEAVSALRRVRLQPFERFAWTWTLVMFFFFSLGTSKLYSYVVGIFPPLAILTASGIERLKARPRPFSLAMGLWIVTLALGSIPLSQYVDRKLGQEAASALLPVIGVMTIASVVAIWAWRLGRVRLGVWLTTGTVVLTHLAVMVWFAPHLEQYRSLKPLVSQLDPIVRDRARVVSFAVSKPGASFYFNQPIQRLDTEAALRGMASTTDQPILCLMTAEAYEKLGPGLKAQWVPVASSQRLKLMQAQGPPSGVGRGRPPRLPGPR